MFKGRGGAEQGQGLQSISKLTYREINLGYYYWLLVLEDDKFFGISVYHHIEIEDCYIVYTVITLYKGVYKSVALFIQHKYYQCGSDKMLLWRISPFQWAYGFQFDRISGSSSWTHNCNINTVKIRAANKFVNTFCLLVVDDEDKLCSRGFLPGLDKTVYPFSTLLFRVTLKQIFPFSFIQKC